MAQIPDAANKEQSWKLPLPTWIWKLNRFSNLHLSYAIQFLYWRAWGAPTSAAFILLIYFHSYSHPRIYGAQEEELLIS